MMMSLFFASTEELNTPTAAVAGAMTTENGYSPPDFDFSMPCRGFKSEFARSLSLNIAAGGHQRNTANKNWSNNNNSNNSCCKSLDYNANMPQIQQRYQRNHKSNLASAKKDCPPLLPQRLSCPIPTTTTVLRGNNNNNGNGKKHNHINGKNEAISTAVASTIGNRKPNDHDAAISSSVPPSDLTSLCPSSPPALPARRALPPTNGRKNAYDSLPLTFQRGATSTLTYFSRQPAATIENNNATSLESICFGSSLRRNNDQNCIDKNYHISYQHDQHNITTTTTTASINNNDNDDAATDSVEVDVGDAASNLEVEQNCSSCNGSLKHISAENETMKTFSGHKQKALLPPKKLQQHHQQHPRTLSLPSDSNKVFPPTAVVSSPMREPVGSTGQQEETKADLENLILKNEIHTLRWQLKQMDTRCEMQRAVLEEMERFLDRYHSHIQRKAQEQQRISVEQMPRSKSLFHVNANGYGNGSGSGIGIGYEVDSGRSSSNSNRNSNASTCGGNSEKENTLIKSMNTSDASNYLRARSSTNIMEMNGVCEKSNRFSNQVNSSAVVDESNSSSYCAFKDYTWRRSPKKPTNNRANKLPTMDDVDMKLSQEAFRLSRTIHNLLNGAIQQTLNAGRLVKAPSSISIMTLQHGASNLHNSTSLTMANDESLMADNHVKDSVSIKSVPEQLSHATKGTTKRQAVDMNFLREHDLRDSRLSMRSSTDSSVHSLTSSSTDEDLGLSIYHPNGPPASLLTHKQLQLQQQQQHHLARHQRQPPMLTASTTEDESGFSSISSFQEIGVPITVAPTKVTALPPQLQVSHKWDGNASNREDSVLWV